jgi:IS5 family transposase
LSAAGDDLRKQRVLYRTGTAATTKGCHLAAIKRNNVKDKNHDLDRWISGIRAPYARVSSKIEKRVRHKGVVRNFFAALMQALCFNIKRFAVLEFSTG